VTRYEVELRDVVLHGLPRGYADDLASLIEVRLAALAAGGAHAGGPLLARDDATARGGPAADGPGAVADALAGRIWAAVEGSQRGPRR
jgi:hypothetical protein